MIGFHVYRYSDGWLHQDKDYRDRRRSSTITNRYSLFDALDLECALLRAAARGSVGPYSLSESLHKLTFTQSLAFPALARGLATKQRRTGQQSSARPSNSHESLLNTFAKVITAVVLFVVSILVFLIVYKFVRTWGLLLAQSNGFMSLNNNATIGYFNFYPANGSTTSTNPFDWQSIASPNSPNSIEPPQQQTNFRSRFDTIYNTTFFGQPDIGRGFNIRHFNSTHRKIKRPSNWSDIT